MTGKRYVVVTAAYNEEKYIEGVLKGVIAQTHKPLRWLIVSDGSTDRTDEIVRQYADRHSFIRLHSITEEHPRNFAAQVNAINSGLDQLRDLEFDFIGNLDSDISFEPGYFEKLLEIFEQDPRLGLGGGLVWEETNGHFEPRRTNSHQAVAHAVQLFRRECFESIGRRYVPLPFGGPDWLAEVSARMKGWHVESFPELKVFHHRPMGTEGGLLRSWFRQGLMDHSLGSHPLFEVFKLIRRVPSNPFMLGAGARSVGFVLGYCRRKERMVSEEFVRFLRKEQMEKVWSLGRTRKPDTKTSRVPVRR